MAKTVKKSVITRGLLISCFIAGLLLLVSNSAVWANRQIFNSEAFSQTATSSLTSQSSRDAVAAKITDEVLQDRPRIQNFAGDSLTSLISGLLDGNRIESVLSKSISKLHIYVTSSDQEDVTLNLAGFKDTINRLVEVSALADRDSPGLQKAENFPDQIVLVQADNIPDFYNYGVVMTFLAPFTFLAALILLVYPYVRNHKNYLSVLAVQGLALIFIGLTALLLGPIFRPITLGPIQDPNVRIIVGNLYDSFVATFNNQTLVLIMIGLTACTFVLGVRIFNIYRASRR